MTRKSIVARQKKREKIVAKFKNKRKQLKSIFASDEENYLSATGIKEFLKKPISRHAEMVEGGIAEAADLNDPKHMNAI